MITAVDTCIILDILSGNTKYCEKSKKAYTDSLGAGKLLICPVVWAELRPWFESDTDMKKIIGKLHLEFDPFDEPCASLAGKIWREYRTNGGKREHLIPDFLVGAHAQIRAERLLTRDRGFFRRYFRELTVKEPAYALDVTCAAGSKTLETTTGAVMPCFR